MTQYTILVEGYAYQDREGKFYSSPTSALIESNGKKILMDPGADADKLIAALLNKNLKPSDVDLIYLTHYHPDHFLNIRLFPNTPVMDGETLWSADGLEVSTGGVIEGTDIRVIKTPGHSVEHTSLIIINEEGTVCLAQDVFWWMDGEQKTDNYEEMINYEDPYAADMIQLKESRRILLEIADWIIPGHGKKFKNNFKK